MTQTRKWLFGMWILIWILAWPSPALASGPQLGQQPDQLVIRDNFTLKSGETLNEDLYVIGGNAVLEQGSLLNGDIAVVGGSLDCSGKVNGDILVLGGNVSLSETAVVEGNITTLGGYLDKDPDAVVEGDIASEIQSGLHVETPTQVIIPSSRMLFPLNWDVIGWLWLPFATFVMATLAMLVVMLWPKQIQHTAQAAISQPLITGGMGLLTVVAGAFVIGILAITIIFSPLALVGFALLVALGVFGWIALGLELGQRFAQALKQDWHPALAAGVGTFALTFVAAGIEKVSVCVGWVVPFLVTLVALGAALLTIFGTREYRGAAPSSAPLVPPPEGGATPQG